MRSFDILDQVGEIDQQLARRGKSGPNAEHLRTLMVQLRPLERDATEVRLQLTALIAELEHLEGVPDLARKVPEWLGLLKLAQGQLAANLTGFVQSVSRNVVRQLTRYVDQYKAHIRLQVGN